MNFWNFTAFTVYCLRTYFADIFSQNFLGFCFFQERKFGEYLCKMPPKKRSKRRDSHEAERMFIREMSDTEQDDLGLETQHDSDSSDEDTQDIQAGGTQKGKGKCIRARLTKGARNLLFCSVLRRSRS